MMYNSAGMAIPSDKSQGTGSQGRPQDGDGQGGAMRSLVKVESVIQLGLVLPIAVFLGWLAGAALDRWLGQHWIYIVGLLLGAVAGFLQIFRFVLAQSKQ